MIYLLISVFLDMFLSQFISLGYQNIGLFFPMLLVGCLPLVYNVMKNKKLFFGIVLFLSVIYDLLYSDIVFINLYYFLLFSLFLFIFYNNRKCTIFNILIVSTLGIVFYDVFIFLILMLLNYADFQIGYFYNKIISSFIINLGYVLLSLFFLKSRIFGYKKRFKSGLKSY